MDATIKERAQKLSEALADNGKIIEGGWAGLRLMAIPADAPQIQIDEMRQAFFAGAQHLFASIMNILDPSDREPTEKDMRRMDLIAQELEQFHTEFMDKHFPAKGSA